MRLSGIGAEGGGVTKGGNGPIEIPHIAQGMAKIPERFRKMGAKGNRFLACGDGFLELAELSQDIAEIAVSFGQIGIERNGLLASGNGLIESARAAEDAAEIGVRFGRIRAEGDRAINQIRRHVELPRLLGQQTEELDGFEMIRLLFQDLSINLFGVAQTSGLMAPERKLERLLNRQLRHALSGTIPCRRPARKSRASVVQFNAIASAP